MDSEDEMHYATDVESLEDYYSGGDTATDYSDDDDGGDYEFMDNYAEDANDTFMRRQQVNYWKKGTNLTHFELKVVIAVIGIRLF